MKTLQTYYFLGKVFSFLLANSYIINASQEEDRNLILESIPKHTFSKEPFCLHAGLEKEDESILSFKAQNFGDLEALRFLKYVIISSEKMKIKELDFSDNNLLTRIGAIDIAAALGFLRKIEIIDVRSTNIDQLGLIAILFKLRTLKQQGSIYYRPLKDQKENFVNFLEINLIKYTHQNEDNYYKIFAQ